MLLASFGRWPVRSQGLYSGRCHECKWRGVLRAAGGQLRAKGRHPDWLGAHHRRLEWPALHVVFPCFPGFPLEMEDFRRLGWLSGRVGCRSHRLAASCLASLMWRARSLGLWSLCRKGWRQLSYRHLRPMSFTASVGVAFILRAARRHFYALCLRRGLGFSLGNAFGRAKGLVISMLATGRAAQHASAARLPCSPSPPWSFKASICSTVQGWAVMPS